MCGIHTDAGLTVNANKGRVLKVNQAECIWNGGRWIGDVRESLI